MYKNIRKLADISPEIYRFEELKKSKVLAGNSQRVLPIPEDIDIGYFYPDEAQGQLDNTQDFGIDFFDRNTGVNFFTANSHNSTVITSKTNPDKNHLRVTDPTDGSNAFLVLPKDVLEDLIAGGIPEMLIV